MTFSFLESSQTGSWRHILKMNEWWMIFFFFLKTMAGCSHHMIAINVGFYNCLRAPTGNQMKGLNVNEHDDESQTFTCGSHKMHWGQQNVNRSSFFQKAFRWFNQIEVFGVIKPNKMFALPPRNHAELKWVIVLP